MNFASDNTAGVSAPIMSAIQAANAGFVPSYGGDASTTGLAERFGEVFERPVSVFLVATGTAANALSLAALAPPWTAVLTSHDAHAMTDECGAVEMFSGGARVVGIEGAHARINLGDLSKRLAEWPGGRPHVLQPGAISVSQASELGAVWTPDELAELGAIAARHGLKVHMDGARFANAVAALGCAPADLTWRAGIAVMSFGATKNGAMGAEAIVVFDAEVAATIEQRRMRSGHLLSKSRFVAAQLHAYLDGGHWLDLAAHANAMAARLAAAIEAAPGARLALPTEANEVFAWIEDDAVAALRQAGAAFYEWSGSTATMGLAPGKAGERLVRLVTSFATAPDEIDRFAEAITG